MFIDFVLYGILSNNPKEATSIRRKADWFFPNTVAHIFYCKSYDGVLLYCLSRMEAQIALQEALGGMYGTHQPRRKLWDQLRRMRYYCLMVSNAIVYAWCCYACQIHADFMHQAPTLCRCFVILWGSMTNLSALFKRSLIYFGDFFSKWMEPITLKEAKALDIIKFIKNHVISRLGAPWKIIHDNWT